MCCFVILLLSNEMQMSVRRFSAIPHLRGNLIPLFVFKLDLFFPRSANFFVFSDLCLRLLIKEKQTHMSKSETRFFSHRCQEENAVLMVLFSLFLEGVEHNL